MNTRQIKHRLTFDDRISPQVAAAVRNQYPGVRAELYELLRRQENWGEDIATPTSRLKALIERYEQDMTILRDPLTLRRQRREKEASKKALGYGFFVFLVSLGLTTPMVGLGSIPLGIIGGIVMYKLTYDQEKY